MIGLTTVLDVLQSDGGRALQTDGKNSTAEDFIRLLPALMNTDTQPSTAVEMDDEAIDLLPEELVDSEKLTEESTEDGEGYLSTAWFDLESFSPPDANASTPLEDFTLAGHKAGVVKNSASASFINTNTADTVITESMDSMEISATEEVEPVINSSAKAAGQVPAQEQAAASLSVSATMADKLFSEKSGRIFTAEESATIDLPPDIETLDSDITKAEIPIRQDASRAVLQKLQLTSMEGSSGLNQALESGNDGFQIKEALSNVFTPARGGTNPDDVLPEILLGSKELESLSGAMQASNPDNSTFQPSRLLNGYRQFDLPQSVQQKDWGEHFNQQIVWLGQQKIKSAVLRLNPQDLGPLEVNIKMMKDHASLHISTHSTQVQEQIEQSLPRLRDMLANHGLELDQVNIEQRNSQSNHNSTSERYQGTDKADRDSGEAPMEEIAQRITEGLVDYFA